MEPATPHPLVEVLAAIDSVPHRTYKPAIMVHPSHQWSHITEEGQREYQAVGHQNALKRRATKCSDFEHALFYEITPSECGYKVIVWCENNCPRDSGNIGY